MQVDDNGMTDSDDRQHLQLLAIFHYVIGGLSLLGGCFPFVHLGIGIVFLTGAFDNSETEPVPDFVGVIFIAAAAILIVAMWTWGAAMIYVGRCLTRRRRRTYCMVIAALQCLMIPVGTVLGVFTLVVLMRPSVQAMFDTADDGFYRP